MAQFKAISPSVEVNGETVLAIVNGMGSFRESAFKYLANAGIIKPAPGQWYSQQAWLNAFKEISDKVGGSTLRMIGKAIPKSAKFPPEIRTLQEALKSIDVAYHMNHRGGPIGNYKIARSEDRKIEMVCDNPYPCEFDRGILTAMCEMFKPSGAIPKVDHDNSSGCRKSGGPSCRYSITW